MKKIMKHVKLLRSSGGEHKSVRDKNMKVVKYDVCMCCQKND